MTAYYNEIEPFAADWPENLIGAGLIAPGDVDRRDIKDVKPDDLRGYTQCHFFAGIGVWSYALRLAGWPDDRPVWTGSCPCQPFSAAGRGKGVADERHLWPHWHHLVDVCAPPVVFGEQVASKDGLEWLDLVQADLETSGYAVGAADICAAGVGAPHIRQRIFFGAVSERSLVELADSDHARLEGRLGVPERPDQRVARPGGMAGGLADGESIGRAGRAHDGDEGRRERAPGPESEVGALDDAAGARHVRAVENSESEARRETRLCVSSEGRGLSERPRPTNGFWRDADWLFCRDGKWRPVEPIHVEMADGAAPAVGSVRAETDFDGEEAFARLQALRDTFGEEEAQRQAGGQWRVSEACLLRSLLYGGLDGRPDEGCGGEEQPSPVGQDGEAELRDVWAGRHEAGCASPGREPDEQRSAQLDDVVRLLPCSLSLAELHGRRDAAESLCFLQRAIREERGLPNASESLEAAWASLGEEAKGRIGMGFDASRWRVVAPFPLSHGAVSRVGRLRAYGNAIVPQVAATFVAAFVESCESI